MSQQVEQRIVEMRFDNKEFEKNAQATMKTLDEFEEKLNFKGASEGLDALNSSAKHFSLHPLTEAAETVEVKFSAMSVAAIAAIQRIVDKAFDAGERLVKSLSTDQITAGWDKYAQKTSAVQTIMAATADQYENTEQQMEDVNKQLEKLNWFTDETSYSLLDMTSNVGKFISNGMGLEDSVTAMQGISTWAAISGGNVQQASSAMYNFSQALGTGSMRAQDWKSIENANMATKEFKETVIETADALGKLEEDEYGKFVWDPQSTKNKKKLYVNSAGFRDSLRAGWFDNEVMMTVLERYGMFSDKLYEVQNTTGLTASQLLEKVEQYKTGALDLADIMDDTTVPAEQLTNLISEMSGDIYDLGWRSFKAAQEAKTFGEALASVKDAVSTGWMNTFELIFGDYENARKLWTNVANELYDVFAESGNARNEMLKEWAGLGGREVLLETISTWWNDFRGTINAVKEAFADIFPPMTGQRLYDLTKKLRDLTQEFKLSDTALQGLKNIIKLILSPFKLLNKNAKTGEGLFHRLTRRVHNLGEKFLGFFSDTESIPDLLKKIFGGKTYEAGAKILETIATTLKTVFDALKDTISKFLPTSDNMRDRLGKLTDKLGTFAEIVRDNVTGALEGVTKIDISGGIKKIIDAFSGLFDYIKNHSLKDAIDNMLMGFKSGDLFSKFVDVVFPRELQEIGYKIKDFLFGKEDSDDPGFIAKAMAAITEVFERLTPVLYNIRDAIRDFVGELSPANTMIVAFGIVVAGLLVSLSNALSSFSNAMSGIGTFFNTITKKIIPKSTPIRDLALAIGTLTVSLVVLSKMDKEGLENAKSAVWAIAGVIAAMSVVGTLLSRFLINEKAVANMAALAGMMTSFGVATLAISAALKIISTVDTKGLLPKVMALGAIMLEFSALAIIVSKFAAGGTLGILSSMSFIGLAAAIAILVGTLKKIQELDVHAVLKTMKPLVLCVASLSALSVAAKGLKLTNALGMIVMAEGMLIFVHVLKKLAKVPMEKIIDGLGQYITIVVLIGILAGAMSIGGKNALSAGAGMLAMALAADILISVIRKLGEMDRTTLIQGGIAAGVMLIVFGAVSKLMQNASRFQFGAGASMIAMALAVDLLIWAVKKIGELKFWDALQGVAAVSAILAVFGLIIKWSNLGPNGKSAAASIVAMIGAIAMLTVALGLITMLAKEDPTALMTAAASLSVLMAAMGVMTSLAKDMKIGSAIAAIIANALLLAEAVATLVILDQAIPDGTNFLPKAEGLAITLGAMAIVFGAISLVAAAHVDQGEVAKLTLAFGLVGLVIDGLVFVMGVLANAEDGSFDKGLGTLKKFNDTGVLKALGMFLGVFGALAIADKLLNVNPKNVILDATVFAGIIALISGVIGIIGAFANLEYNGKAIGMGAFEKGFEVLKMFNDKDVFGALGKFFEAFAVFVALGAIEKIAKGALDGAGMAALKWTAIFDGVVLLISALVGALGAIDEMLGGKGTEWLTTGADLLGKVGEAIGKFVGGIVGGFGEEVINDLTKASDNLSKLVDALKGLNADDVKASVSVLGEFRDIAKSLGVSGGQKESISSTFNSFGTGITKLGEGLAAYNESVTGLDVEAMRNAYEEIKRLVTVQNSILQNDQTMTLDDFADNVEAIGKGVYKYTQQINKVKTWENIDPARKAIVSLVGIQNSLGDKGSLQGAIFGGNPMTLKNFADYVKKLGEGVAAYANSISGIENFEKFDVAEKAIRSLVDIQNSLGEKGSLKGAIFGGDPQDLSGFGLGMTYVGQGLTELYSVEGLTYANISLVKYALTTLSEIQNSLGSNGGVAGWLFGESNNLGDFGDALVKLGYNLAAYARQVGPIDWDSVQESLDYLAKIATSINELGGIDQTAAEKMGAAMTDVANVGTTTFVQKLRDDKDKVVGIGQELLSWFGIGTSNAQQVAENSGEQTVNSVISGVDSKQDEAVAGGQKTGTSFMDGFLSLLGIVNNGGVQYTQEAVAGMLSVSGSVTDAASELAQDGKEAAGAISYYGTGQNAGQGFVDGLRSKLRAAKEAATSVASAAKQALKDFLDIKSPSKEFEKLGEFTVMGFNLGLLENIRSVKESGGVLGDTLVSEVFGMMSDLTDSDMGLEINPVVRPVLDLSSMQGSVGYVNGMVATLGQMDFVGQANLAMQMPNNHNQNAAILNAVNGLNARVGAMDESILRLQATVNGGLVDSVAAGVRDGLNGTAVMADKTRIGAVVTDYQRTMARRGV